MKKCSGRRMNSADNIFIHVVSLGCVKNRVDTEHMLGLLSASNAVLVDKPEDADVIIVNTCGFINEAKQESIDVILEMAGYKQNGVRALIVTGCLAQRYASELADELPEVDAFLGVSSYSRILDAIRSALGGKRFICCGRTDGELEGRVLTTPSHLAYVRIADGCSNNCSYCAIPKIRGPLKSRNMENVLRELEELRKSGVSEAILIAQDTTRYGEDLGKRALAELITEAADIMQGGWLRVMYCYPDGVTDDIIEAILSNDNVCRYMDIPMQHFSDDVLLRMDRRQTLQTSKSIVKKLHEAGFTLRTSLIVGFPGETNKDFEIMLDTMKELEFERLGVFKYSAEEGTKAAFMQDQVAEDIKQQRFEAAMALQEGISQKLCQQQIGSSLKVIVDCRDDETGMYIGRTAGQAPEIDGITYISAKKGLTPGAFHDVLITDAYEYDLLGEAQ